MFSEKDDLKCKLLRVSVPYSSDGVDITQNGGVWGSWSTWLAEHIVIADLSLHLLPPAGRPGAAAEAGAPMARRGSRGAPEGSAVAGTVRGAATLPAGARSSSSAGCYSRFS